RRVRTRTRRQLTAHRGAQRRQLLRSGGRQVARSGHLRPCASLSRMSTPATNPDPDSADAGPALAAEHLPIADGEGCLEILSDRLRRSPGVVAIEADFRDSTLTVRYEPGRVE